MLSMFRSKYDLHILDVSILKHVFLCIYFSFFLFIFAIFLDARFWLFLQPMYFLRIHACLGGPIEMFFTPEGHRAVGGPPDGRAGGTTGRWGTSDVRRPGPRRPPLLLRQPPCCLYMGGGTGSPIGTIFVLNKTTYKESKEIKLRFFRNPFFCHLPQKLASYGSSCQCYAVILSRLCNPRVCRIASWPIPLPSPSWLQQNLLSGT